MTAIHPDALLAAMPNLDANVACEWGGVDCDEPAVWRVRAHGTRTPTDAKCADHTLPLCDTHLAELRVNVDRLFRECPRGLYCAHCKLIARQVSDILLWVVAL